MREYEKFYQRRMDGEKEAVRTSSHPTWRGISREQVPWYPSVYEDMCDGCGKCLSFCPNDVFDWGEGNRVLIVEPFNCLVGCDACVKVCPRGAISFPSRTVLENLGR